MIRKLFNAAKTRILIHCPTARGDRSVAKHYSRHHDKQRHFSESKARAQHQSRGYVMIGLLEKKYNWYGSLVKVGGRSISGSAMNF